MAPKAKPKKESAEQLRARQEMEALAAAEQEAARQAAARVKLREVAAREAAMTAVNSRRLNAEWVQRMRSAKLEELQAEARTLSKQHDAAVDRCDRLAEDLLEDLAVQNAQHDAAATAHSRVLDELRGMHRERLAALHSQFSSDLQAVQEEFESEKADMAALHLRGKKEMADIMTALQQAYTDTRAAAAAHYRLQEEEVHNRMGEAYNVTKLSLDGRIKELEGQVEAEKQAHTEATAEQEEAYRELAAADVAETAAIEQRTQRLRHLQETIAQWRGRIVANSSEWQRRNAALAKEKEIVLGHHTALKAALAKFRAGQEARLKKLCVSYASVEAELKQHLETAQRLVRLATLCRKHELPGEAADGAAGSDAGGMPTSQAPAGAGIPQHASLVPQAGCGAESSQPSSPSFRMPCSSPQANGCNRPSLPAPAVDALAELGLQPGSSAQRLVDAFVRRMNAALLDSAAIEQQKLQFAAENAQLSAAIRAVQEGSSVGAGTLQNPLNSLLIVNERLQQGVGVKASSGHPC